MTSPRRSLIPAAVLILAACAGSGADGGVETAGGTPAGTVAMAPTPHAPNVATAPGDTSGGGQADAALTAVVYKDANCGCCAKWVDHVRAAGIRTESNDVTDLNAVKTRYGVPRSLYSCHTAEIGGYVVEGHVPADLIRKMLSEKPDIAGIAVPGMPVGSPGMEGPYTEPYDVIAFTKSGSTSVYAKR